jgi:hypothetical protein
MDATIGDVATVVDGSLNFISPIVSTGSRHGSITSMPTVMLGCLEKLIRLLVLAWSILSP